MPQDGLNIRAPTIVSQEDRLHNFKRYALSPISANELDKIMMPAARRRRSASYDGQELLDVRQALEDLGIDEVKAAKLGIRLYKVACPWPLEPEGVRGSSPTVSSTIIVVEEKRSLIETQLKEQLRYGRAHAPVIVGKHDETGGWLFPVQGRARSKRHRDRHR